MEDDGVAEAECFLHPKEEEDSSTISRNTHATASAAAADEKKKEQDMGNIGLLGNIISHLVSPKPPQHDKLNQNEGVVGPLFDNIVSHFPTSLPDDAAPTSDEASILIHSIVHD